MGPEPEIRVHRAELAFRLGDEATAHAVAGALQVEAAEGPEGSRAEVRPQGETVHVQLEAATLSDLRAALNSMVRLLDTAARSAAPAKPGNRNR